MENGKLIFEISETWKTAFPKAYVGVLVMSQVSNPAIHPELDKLKIELENKLKAKYISMDRKEMESIPVMQSYIRYYKSFEKTYHILLQLESIVKKGKSIPKVAALVEAMFMAEMQDMLLTAGHDYDLLQKPLIIEVAKGDEKYTLMRGQEQILKAGDMFIADQAGIISNIVYGPDKRTQINENTRNVVFTVYAPPGINIDDVSNHLQTIQRFVKVISPDSKIIMQSVFEANR
jgi:DNA/RNA-binding domain of Phe-tRNA-synthetase-like protein